MPDDPGGGGGKPDDPGGGGGKPGGEGDCPTGSAGHDATLDGSLPGGFGWLVNNGTCQAYAPNKIADEDPGNDVPQECSAETIKEKLLDNIVYLPIFEAVNGLGGSNGQYTLAGYAGFYVTGYMLSSGNKAYQEPDGVDCDTSTFKASPSDTCLRGWFTTGVLSEGEIDENSTTDFGVKIIALDE